MHRTITVGLLSICLVVFLCPAVGKTDVISWTLDKPAIVFASQHQSCVIQTKACPKVSQHHGNCSGQQKQNSQPSHCCPAPCSALVLIWSVPEQPRMPDFDTDTISASDREGVVRADRPPSPPPRT